MRRYTNGGELGDLSYWNSYSGAAINGTTKRTGGYSYYFSNTAYYALKNIVPLYEFYYRFAVYMTSVVGTSTTRIVTFGTLGQAISDYIRVDTLGRLCVHDYTGNQVAVSQRSLKASQWNLIEIHIIFSTTNGRITVKLNTIQEIDYTGITLVSDYPCTSIEHGRMTHYLDDIALNDIEGDVNNSWCGDGHLEIIKADGNGDVIQWSPNTGLNWQAIDELPPNNDTDYVTTSGIGIQDMYTMAAYTGAGKIISQIWVEAVAKDNSATGTGILKLGVKTNGEVYLGSGILIPSVYETVYGDIMTTNPYTTSGWTADDINNIQLVIESD